MKINYNSDFSFSLIYNAPEGASMPSCDFSGKVWSGDRQSQAYAFNRINGICTNCAVDGDVIRVACDSHGLMPGYLSCSIDWLLPDAAMPDGVRTVTKTGFLGIELSDFDDGTEMPDFEVEENYPYAIITSYEIAVAAGYRGTAEQWHEALTAMPGAIEGVNAAVNAASAANEGIVAAEALRAEAETLRVAAESARNEAEGHRADAENARSSAEAVRKSAEASRVSAEGLRESAESSRVSAEIARNAAENQRAEAEGLRASAEGLRVSAEGLRAAAESSRAEAEGQRAAAEADRAAAWSTLVGNAQNATEAANAATQSLESVTTRINSAYDSALRLERDLAQYEDEEAVALAVGQNNKAVDISGAIVSKTGYAVSQPVRLKKGYTYLYRTAAGTAIANGVALAARLITTPTPVVIDYTYSYDAQNRIVSATANHSGETYDFAYDSDGVATITDSHGSIMSELPTYRIAERGSCVPMFVSLSDTLPKSGYYAILCNEDCDAVFSAPAPLQSAIAVSYGFVRSLVNQKEDKAVVKQLKEERLRYVGETAHAAKNDIVRGADGSAWVAVSDTDEAPSLGNAHYEQLADSPRRGWKLNKVADRDDLTRIAGKYVNSSLGISTESAYNIAYVRLEGCKTYYIEAFLNNQYSSIYQISAFYADGQTMEEIVAAGKRADEAVYRKNIYVSDAYIAGFATFKPLRDCYLAFSKRGDSDWQPIASDIYECEVAVASLSDTLSDEVGDIRTMREAVVLTKGAEQGCMAWLNKGVTLQGVTASRDGWHWIPSASTMYNAEGADQLKGAILKKNGGVLTAFFRDCVNLHKAYCDFGRPTMLNNMFRRCLRLTEVNAADWDMSAVTTISLMFEHCYSLRSIDCGGWDTSKVADMSYAFEGCLSLGSLDLSGWDVSKVNVLHSMFNRCHSLRWLNVSGLVTSRVASLSNVFGSCASLTSLDLSSWDVSNVTTLDNLFDGCSRLQSVDLSGWDTSKVTTMGYMFYGCSSMKTLDLSGLDVSKVKSFNNLFYGMTSLESLDLSGWDTSALTTFNDTTFYSDTALRFITLGANFFKTTVALKFNRASSLGLNADGSSNGWIEHLAAVAPTITDGQARTIQLPSALKGKAWAQQHIATLQSKGYTIS